MRWDEVLRVEKDQEESVAAYTLVQGETLLGKHISGGDVGADGGGLWGNQRDGAQIVAGAERGRMQSFGQTAAGRVSVYKRAHESGVHRMSHIVVGEEAILAANGLSGTARELCAAYPLQHGEKSWTSLRKGNFEKGIYGSKEGSKGEGGQKDEDGAGCTGEREGDGREYIIWSSDFHTGPVGSLKKVSCTLGTTFAI